MVFDNISFIKADIKPDYSFSRNNYAPMFRKNFVLEEVEDAELFVCALGIGYVYINGKEVSKDLFCAPFGNYNKTLWYNQYDVTKLLTKGENTIAVICGNGWYNEDVYTGWKFHEADWRDVPKFILNLIVSGKSVVSSDKSWKTFVDGPHFFNALRSGEYFDSRKYDPSWTTASYDDSSWQNAIIDTNPPKGTFRQCLCEPIWEHEILPSCEAIKVSDNKYVFDIGRNISGYSRIETSLSMGTELTIRYAEQLTEDLNLELNNSTYAYGDTPFQTDKLICNGKKLVWSPRFTYHGFRFIEITGIDNIEKIKVSGVFVHQAVEQRTVFECSDETLCKMFNAGIASSYSNMFYLMTDCPTREKLGWTNDAQASCEQLIINLKSENMFKKWLQDIYDAQREDGSLPGVIPTSGYGYAWGNGPVSDGILFEIPYRLYVQTGDEKPLINSLPYFDKYLSHLDEERDENGFINFGLDDWSALNMAQKIPLQLINLGFEYEFCRIAALSAKLQNIPSQKYEDKMEQIKELTIKTYILPDGSCSVNEQTAVAHLIYYGLYNKLEPLKNQLQKLVCDANYHHDCGMVGIRRLFNALTMCGLGDIAYKVLTVKGYPGYSHWFDNDATTLWERWELKESRNHHMYSGFMAWMVQNILGIKIREGSVGYTEVDIEPEFFEGLTFAKGSSNTVKGMISVSWKIDGDKVNIEIDIPEKINAYYKNEKLNTGKNIITEIL